MRDELYTFSDGDAIQAFDRNIHLRVLHGYGVVDGCEVTLDSGTLGDENTVTIGSGEISVAGRAASVSTTSLSIPPADSVNDRWDVIIADGDGEIDLIEGIPEPRTPDTNDPREAERPAPASLDGEEGPRNAVALGLIWISSGTNNIGSSDIFDVRLPSRIIANTFESQGGHFFAESGERQGGGRFWEYVGECGGAANQNHYILLFETSEESVRLNGTFYGQRDDPSSTRVSDEITVAASTNSDATDFGGGFFHKKAEDNTSPEVSLVTLNYGGDEYVALELSVGTFRQYQDVHFTGYYRNIDDFGIINSNEVSNLEDIEEHTNYDGGGVYKFDGRLDLESGTISREPSDDEDIVNKEYVDQHGGGGTGSPQASFVTRVPESGLDNSISHRNLQGEELHDPATHDHEGEYIRPEEIAGEIVDRSPPITSMAGNWYVVDDDSDPTEHNGDIVFRVDEEIDDDDDDNGDDPDPPEPDEYELTVVAEDSSDGSSIQGASVTVNGNSGSTDSSGEVSFTLEEGSYTIDVSHSDYEDESRSISLTSNTTETFFLDLEDPDDDTPWVDNFNRSSLGSAWDDVENSGIQDDAFYVQPAEYNAYSLSGLDNYPEAGGGPDNDGSFEFAVRYEDHGGSAFLYRVGWAVQGSSGVTGSCYRLHFDASGPNINMHRVSSGAATSMGTFIGVAPENEGDAVGVRVHSWHEGDEFDIAIHDYDWDNREFGQQLDRQQLPDVSNSLSGGGVGVWTNATTGFSLDEWRLGTSD